jgi:ribosome maturation factor RimP
MIRRRGFGLTQAITETVERMLQPYIDAEGFELVDVEYIKEGNNYFLRVYVDKPGGIDIDDCGKISEYLSEKLDEKDPIPTAYFLEVSSPGAERPLKKPDDYRRSIGQHVLITTLEAIQGHKEFEGKLQAYDESKAVVLVGKKEIDIQISNIASARLAIVM